MRSTDPRTASFIVDRLAASARKRAAKPGGGIVRNFKSLYALDIGMPRLEQPVVNCAENLDLGQHMEQDAVAVAVDLHQNSRIRLRKQTLIGNAAVPRGIGKIISRRRTPVANFSRMENSESMASFMFGIDAGDHVIVEINGRPDEHDDWLATTISVRAGSFTGAFDATLVTTDFPTFRRQLEQLYESLEGSAIFDTVERQLKIECTGDGRGGIAIDGIAQDRPGYGNELRFRFETDQTFLRTIISELQQIESEFPNKVHPPFPQ